MPLVCREGREGMCPLLVPSASAAENILSREEIAPSWLFPGSAGKRPGAYVVGASAAVQPARSTTTVKVRRVSS